MEQCSEVAKWIAGSDYHGEPVQALMRCLVGSLDELLREVAARVGGDVPDSVCAYRDPAPLVAAAAVWVREGRSGRLRVLLAEEALGVVEEAASVLASAGLATIVRVRFEPGGRLSVRDVVRRIARAARGASTRLPDVTDATPLVPVGLYAGGVRAVTYLVRRGWTAVFERSGFTA